MKKITLSIIALFAAGSLSAQAYSTGIVNLSTTTNLAMSVKIDVADDLVTMELTGPSTRYFAVGFGVDGMDEGGDCVIYTESPTPALTDRTFVGTGEVPILDANQSWTIISNTVSGNQRTIVATRAAVSPGNYTFNAAAGSLPLVWARSSAANYNLSYHGGPNKGTVVANVTLANTEFLTDSFKMFPNPSEGVVTVTLPQNLSSAIVKFYNAAGQLVKEQEISDTQNQVDTKTLASGSYMVVLRTEAGNAVKTLFVK